MKKAKNGVKRDDIAFSQPEILKAPICTFLVKKIQFGKISAQRLVISGERVESDDENENFESIQDDYQSDIDENQNSSTTGH